MESDRLHRILKPRKPKKPLENTITKRILKEIGPNLSGKNYFPTEMTPLLFKWLEIQLKHGLSMEDAVNMIVNGFCKEVFAELPMEFAVEAQKLMEISLEGSVG